MDAEGSLHGSYDFDLAPEYGASVRFGRSVASLGDIDGNGYGDLIIGASGPSFDGAVIASLGPQGLFFTVELRSGTFGMPTYSSSRAGADVSGLGDVNVDGVPDAVIAMPNYAPQGAVLVVTLQSNGTPSGSYMTTGDDPRLPLGSEKLGTSVSGVPDFDGDGTPDLAAGVPDYGGMAGAGAVLILLLNSTDGSSHGSVLLSSTHPQLAFMPPGARMGESLALVGAMDGSEVPSLIVGCTGYDVPGMHNGSLLLLNFERNFSSPTAGLLLSRASLANQGMPSTVIPGSKAGYSELGLSGSVGRLGNSSTVSFVLSGMLGMQPTGPWLLPTTLHYAPMASWDEPGIALGSQGEVVPAEAQPGNGFGASLAWLDNLDGSWGPDLAISNYTMTSSEVSLVFLSVGNRPLHSVRINMLNPAPLYANATSSDSAGRSLAPAGDVNGDGIADLIVGAPNWMHGGERVGTVIMLLLRLNGQVLASKELLTSFDDAGNHVASNAEFGTSLARLPTSERGGAATSVAVGAPGLNSCSVFVLHITGNISVLPHEASETIKGVQVQYPEMPSCNQFGSSVASVPDMDGDGFPDLAVGASTLPGPQGTRGAVLFLSMGASRGLLSYDPIFTIHGAMPTFTETSKLVPSTVQLLGHSLSAAGPSWKYDGCAMLVAGLPNFHVGEGNTQGLLLTLHVAPGVGLAFAEASPAGQGVASFNGTGLGTAVAAHFDPNTRVSHTAASAPSSCAKPGGACILLKRSSKAAKPGAVAPPGMPVGVHPALGTLEATLVLGLAQPQSFLGRSIASLPAPSGASARLAVGVPGTGFAFVGAVQVRSLGLEPTDPGAFLTLPPGPLPGLTAGSEFGTALLWLGEFSDVPFTEHLLVSAPNTSAETSLWSVGVAVDAFVNVSSLNPSGLVVGAQARFGQALASGGLGTFWPSRHTVFVGAPLHDGSKGHVSACSVSAAAGDDSAPCNPLSFLPWLTQPTFFLGASLTAVPELDSSGVPGLAGGAVGGFGENATLVWVATVNVTGQAFLNVTWLTEAALFGGSTGAAPMPPPGVHCSGDITGDGVPDLLVAQPFESDGLSAAGALHFVSLSSADAPTLLQATVSNTKGGAFPPFTDFVFDAGSDLGLGAALYHDALTSQVMLAIGAPGYTSVGLSGENRGGLWTAPVTGAVPPIAWSPSSFPSPTPSTSSSPSQTPSTSSSPSPVPSVSAFPSPSPSPTASPTLVASPSAAKFPSPTTAATQTPSTSTTPSASAAQTQSATPTPSTTPSDPMIDPCIPFPVCGCPGYMGTTMCTSTSASDSPAPQPSPSASTSVSSTPFPTPSSVPSASVAGTDVLNNDTLPGGVLLEDGFFGSDIAWLGSDFPGGPLAFAVCAPGPIDSSPSNAKLFVLQFSGGEDGTLEGMHTFSQTPQSIREMSDFMHSDVFFAAVAALGDTDGDGTFELAVGMRRSGTGGGVFRLSLDGDLQFGTSVATYWFTRNSPLLGTAVAALGARRGNATVALGDASNHTNLWPEGPPVDDYYADSLTSSDDEYAEGAIAILDLSRHDLATLTWYTAAEISTFVPLDPEGAFGRSLAHLPDVNADGSCDLAVGSPRSNLETDLGGAVTILFLSRLAFPVGGQVIVGTGGLGTANLFQDQAGGGSSLVHVGDVNGDGIPDITVGAKRFTEPGEATNTGAVQVLALQEDGSVKGVLAHIDGEPWERGNVASHFGAALAAFPEPESRVGLMVGLPRQGYRHSGEVVKFSTSLEDFSGTLDSAAGTSLCSQRVVVRTTLIEPGAPCLNTDPVSGDALGTAVAWVGYDDAISVFALGAPGEQPMATNGSVVLFRDFSDPPCDSGFPPNRFPAHHLDMFATSSIAHSQFGYAVAPIGDVGGNSLDDIAVGAPSYSGGDRGGVFLLWGGHNEWTPGVEISSGTGLVVDPASKFGFAVAGIGDFGGEGATELAVSAPGSASGNGSVYMIQLQQGGTWSFASRISQGLGGFSYGGLVHQLGSAVAAAGDINGDGFMDLAVGCESCEGTGTFGAVFLWFLDQQTQLIDWRHISDGSAAVLSLGVGSRFGYSAVGLGDVNGDAVPDLLIGVGVGAGSSPLPRGAFALLYMARSGFPLRAVALQGGQAGVNRTEIEKAPPLGRSVAVAPQHGSDGALNILAGAPFASAVGTTQSGGFWTLETVLRPSPGSLPLCAVVPSACPAPPTASPSASPSPTSSPAATRSPNPSVSPGSGTSSLVGPHVTQVAFFPSAFPPQTLHVRTGSASVNLPVRVAALGQLTSISLGVVPVGRLSPSEAQGVTSYTQATLAAAGKPMGIPPSALPAVPRLSSTLSLSSYTSFDSSIAFSVNILALQAALDGSSGDDPLSMQGLFLFNVTVINTATGQVAAALPVSVNVLAPQGSVSPSDITAYAVPGSGGGSGFMERTLSVSATGSADLTWILLAPTSDTCWVSASLPLGAAMVPGTGLAPATAIDLTQLATQGLTPLVQGRTAAQTRDTVTVRFDLSQLPSGLHVSDLVVALDDVGGRQHPLHVQLLVATVQPCPQFLRLDPLAPSEGNSLEVFVSKLSVRNLGSTPALLQDALVLPGHMQPTASGQCGGSTMDPAAQFATLQSSLNATATAWLDTSLILGEPLMVEAFAERQVPLLVKLNRQATRNAGPYTATLVMLMNDTARRRTELLSSVVSVDMLRGSASLLTSSLVVPSPNVSGLYVPLQLPDLASIPSPFAAPDGTLFTVDGVVLGLAVLRDALGREHLLGQNILAAQLSGSGNVTRRRLQRSATLLVRALSSTERALLPVNVKRSLGASDPATPVLGIFLPLEFARRLQPGETLQPTLEARSLLIVGGPLVSLPFPQLTATPASCPEGAERDGSIACRCKAGHGRVEVPGTLTAHSLHCTPCAAGTFGPKPTLGLASSPSVCVRCGEGGFSFPGAVTCSACPLGAVCVDGRVSLLQGYGLAHSSGVWDGSGVARGATEAAFSQAILLCPNPLACLPGDTSGGATAFNRTMQLTGCAGGHEGELCASCTSDHTYAPPSGGASVDCLPCGAVPGLALAFAMLLGLALLVGMTILWLQWVESTASPLAWLTRTQPSSSQVWWLQAPSPAPSLQDTSLCTTSIDPQATNTAVKAFRLSRPTAALLRFVACWALLLHLQWSSQLDSFRLGRGVASSSVSFLAHTASLLPIHAPYTSCVLGSDADPVVVFALAVLLPVIGGVLALCAGQVAARLVAGGAWRTASVAALAVSLFMTVPRSLLSMVSVFLTLPASQHERFMVADFSTPADSAQHVTLQVFSALLGLAWVSLALFAVLWTLPRLLRTARPTEQGINSDAVPILGSNPAFKSQGKAPVGLRADSLTSLAAGWTRVVWSGAGWVWGVFTPTTWWYCAMWVGQCLALALVASVSPTLLGRAYAAMVVTLVGAFLHFYFRPMLMSREALKYSPFAKSSVSGLRRLVLASATHDTLVACVQVGQMLQAAASYVLIAWESGAFFQGTGRANPHVSPVSTHTPTVHALVDFFVAIGFWLPLLLALAAAVFPAAVARAIHFLLSLVICGRVSGERGSRRMLSIDATKRIPSTLLVKRAPSTGRQDLSADAKAAVDSRTSSYMSSATSALLQAQRPSARSFKTSRSRHRQQSRSSKSLRADNVERSKSAGVYKASTSKLLL